MTDCILSSVAFVDKRAPFQATWGEPPDDGRI
jgi:hypothetical protein